MKKALALLLAVLMLLSSVALIASAEGDQSTAEFNLADFFGATYVGKALGADDAKPVQDGTIGDNEYQSKFVVNKSGEKYTGRGSVPAALLEDYTEYVSHDAEWIYVGFEFYNMSTNARGRFYWNLSFIDSLDFVYAGGDSVDTAFTQNGKSIYNGWNFGGEIAENPTDGTTDDYVFSTRENKVPDGTTKPDINALPTEGENDGVVEVFVTADKTMNPAITKKDDGSWPDDNGVYTTHQVYEFKVSKAWYAAQVGLASAADVRELAWATVMQYANYYGTQYTQVSNYLTDDDLAAFQALNGVEYTGTSFGAQSHPYDKGMLPRAIILDVEPVEFNLADRYGATYVGKALGADDAKPVQDGVIGDNEYQSKFVVDKDEAKYSARGSVPATLLGDYTEYVSHDAEWIYVGFDFYNQADNLRGRFYWNLSFITSHDFVYGSGADANSAFTQNGVGIYKGWNYGAEIGADAPAAGEAFAFSMRNNEVAFGTKPDVNTLPEGENDGVVDVYLAMGRTDNADLNGVYTDAPDGVPTSHQVYEFKVSKAWYAAQVGLDSADDVRELAWATILQYANYYGTSYTQISNFLTDEDIAAFKAANGVEYTGTNYGTTNNSYPYDNGMLPRAIVLDECPTVEMNLEEWYGAKYVGAALGADDAKPVQDGVISLGEYQAEYIIARGDMENFPTETSRDGVPALLLGDFKQFISHDADYIYVGFAFSNGTTNTRGRLYWNLSFIDSFDVTYYGGSTIADAFKQGEYAINDGWNFGAEIAESAGDDGSYGYSERNNAVTRGTAPVKDTDFALTVNKVTPITLAGTNRQVYEFKVSKAWYAAQAGLESAADVRELAWVVLGQEINTGASRYTQIGHYLSDDELAELEATGRPYTMPNAGTYGHPYDNAMLPLLFVLDADPNAEGEQTNVPAEIVEPMGAVPTPDQPGEEGGEGNDDIVPPTGDDNTTTTAPATTTAATTTAKATTAADTTAAATTAAAKKGCKASVAVSALVLLPTLAGGALLIKRRKED